MKDGSSSTLKGAIIFLFLLIQAFIASSPLLEDGWFLSHDATWHLDRLVAVAHELDLGDYYPRWLSTAAFGKGLPVLNYYSPGIYLIAGYLHVFGVSLLLSLKIMCISLFFLGSLGMFLWVRRHCALFGALIAATLYTFVPYHFVDIYVRGAIPEFAAMALLPFLFYGIDRMFSEYSYFSGILLTGATTALIIVTHNLSAFMIMPFALVYFTWCVYAVKPPLRKIAICASGPILGLGLSAAYWLPATTEIGYLAHFKESILSFSYILNFIQPTDWFSSRWGFGFAFPKGNATMSFQIGYVLSVFVLMSTLTVLAIRGKERSFGLITLVLGMLGLFLTISPSAIIYDQVSLVQYVQFPWRYLGIATLFLSALTGLSANWKYVGRIPHGPMILLCCALGCSVLLSHTHREVLEKTSGDIDQIGRSRIVGKNIGVMSVGDEYLPKWSDESVIPLRFDEILLPFPSTSTLKVDNVETKGSKIRFRIESEGGVNLAVSQFYFPGWKATIDGRYRPVAYTAEGFVTLTIPPGVHSVQLWFGTTTPRIIGWLITIVTLLTLLFFKVRKKS